MLNDIEAVLFDMDGTLWDTERVTERAIAQLLDEWQLDARGVDLIEFHGIKWSRIGDLLTARFPALAGRDPAAEISQRFHEIQEREPAPPTPGAPEAFRAAVDVFGSRVAIVTGSESPSVEQFIDHAGLRDLEPPYVSADMYERSKPDPECFLMAASRLVVPPERCLVFEDSEAGMQAAAAATMRCVAITAGVPARIETARQLADEAIDDFTKLPARFFRQIAAD